MAESNSPDPSPSPAAMHGSRFTAAIGQFARRYADQNERDHAQLVSAIAAGAVESLPS